MTPSDGEVSITSVSGEVVEDSKDTDKTTPSLKVPSEEHKAKIPLEETKATFP